MTDNRELDLTEVVDLKVGRDAIIITLADGSQILLSDLVIGEVLSNSFASQLRRVTCYATYHHYR